MQAWAKINSAAKYSGVSPRTLREWLKKGLEHSRLPSGTILIQYAAIDEFLKRFRVSENKVDEIVDEFFSRRP